MHALPLINRLDGKIAKTIAIFLDECFLISGFDDAARRDAILYATAMLAAQRNVRLLAVCGGREVGLRLADRRGTCIQLQRCLIGFETQDQLPHLVLYFPPLRQLAAEVVYVNFRLHVGCHAESLFTRGGLLIKKMHIVTSNVGIHVFRCIAVDKAPFISGGWMMPGGFASFEYKR
ncbi:hypothetical protein [Herbaspirillum autotrophicum]|uniref:hypothetical protein n=1 Tax=Herbaspirillum autotrophicum TaxID=180195 RepID=UPI000A87059C|nr:hypothetical protein [Herbaspirillum autotrophicum]